ncbi:MAG: hypothetical protein KGL63_14825 [Betaproteobacteria bacterium]|nr:hypothetical protein [Betaproteobacteria bacterium]
MVDPQNQAPWATIWAIWEVIYGIGSVGIGAIAVTWSTSRWKAKVESRIDEVHTKIEAVREDVGELRTHVDERFRTRDAQRAEDMARIERTSSESMKQIDGRLKEISGQLAQIFGHLLGTNKGG